MFDTWFRLLMERAVPNPVPPSSFTAEQLSQLRAPTLAFFGTRDAVVGDAQQATDLAAAIPDARIEVLDSGHLIGAEWPERVNPAIAAFLEPIYPG